MNSKLWFLSLALIPLSASTGYALTRLPFGAISGGGGQGVVCNGPSGKTVQLLDLWEAQTLFSEIPIPQTDLASGVGATLVALQNSYPLLGTCQDAAGNTTTDQSCVLMYLTNEAKAFLSPADRVHRLRNVILTRTDDAYEVAKPDGCDIQQIVNYQPGGTILINQDLFEKLDVTNQVALIAHESYYSTLRTFNKEPNSIRTRRAIGYVMSGHVFPLRNLLRPVRYVQCMSTETPWISNALTFYPDAQGQSKAIIIQLTGLVPIGLSDNIALAGPFDFSNADPTRHDCKTGYTSFSSTGQLNGPVEFDRQLDFAGICKDGKMLYYLSTTQPGENKEIRTEMTCDYFDVQK